MSANDDGDADVAAPTVRFKFKLRMKWVCDAEPIDKITENSKPKKECIKGKETPSE